MLDSTPSVLMIIVIAALVTVILAFFLFKWTFSGATLLFAFAVDQRFVGVVAYFLAWLFLFPFMLIASVALGLFEGLIVNAVKREAKREARRLPNEPPNDAWERHKWANRLPPYDKAD